MSGQKIAGLLLTIFGVLGAGYSGITIANDKSKIFGYTYTSPFTTHETVMLSLLVIGVILSIVGIVLLCRKEN